MKEGREDTTLASHSSNTTGSPSSHGRGESDQRSQAHSTRSTSPVFIPSSPTITSSDIHALRSNLRHIPKPLPSIPGSSPNNSPQHQHHEEPLPFHKPRSNDIYIERPTVLDIEIGGGRKRFQTTASKIIETSPNESSTIDQEKTISTTTSTPNEDRNRSNSGGTTIGGSLQFQHSSHSKGTSNNNSNTNTNNNTNNKKVSPIKELLTTATISSVQYHYPNTNNNNTNNSTSNNSTPTNTSTHNTNGNTSGTSSSTTTTGSPQSPPLPPKRPQRIFAEEKVIYKYNISSIIQSTTNQSFTHS